MQWLRSSGLQLSFGIPGWRPDMQKTKRGNRKIPLDQKAVGREGLCRPLLVTLCKGCYRVWSSACLVSNRVYQSSAAGLMF